MRLILSVESAGIPLLSESNSNSNKIDHFSFLSSFLTGFRKDGMTQNEERRVDGMYNLELTPQKYDELPNVCLHWESSDETELYTEEGRAPVNIKL
jgi:hypothetical protein